MSEDRVTLRDVYDALSRVEAKYDKRFEKIEQDIDQIKSFQNRMYGIAAVLSVFVSSAASYVWSKLITK